MAGHVGEFRADIFLRVFVAEGLGDDQPALHLQESVHVHRERWGVFDDDTHSSLVVGPRNGDLRAAVAPFVANKSIGASCPPVRTSLILNISQHWQHQHKSIKQP